LSGSMRFPVSPWGAGEAHRSLSVVSPPGAASRQANRRYNPM
jgi:hypothetical protein